MTEKVSLLKMLTADTAVRARLKVRTFRPTVSSNLNSSTGLWSNWSATVIDSEGDTALMFKKFFGSVGDREKAVKKHCEIFTDGCVVVINSAGKSQGCKGNPTDLLYNSTSSSTSLEITSATTLNVQAKGDAAIPNRPKVRRTLGKLGGADITRRVESCGIVQNVTTATIEAKDGKEARDYPIVEIIDDTSTGAKLTL